MSWLKYGGAKVVFFSGGGAARHLLVQSFKRAGYGGVRWYYGERFKFSRRVIGESEGGEGLG